MSVVKLSNELPAPKGWVRAELEQDSSWIRPLTAHEITDLETSLRKVLALTVPVCVMVTLFWSSTSYVYSMMSP